MSAAKVHLSEEEFRLIRDPGVILTKNSVMTKVVTLMAALSEAYRPLWAGVEEAFQSSVGGNSGATAGAAGTLAESAGALASPKISRGENYLGLPWVMLDYPRFFGREDVFAIRTMFWWGHAFSTTLHLKGKYKELYLPVIEPKWRLLAAAGFHAGLSEDEWQHEHSASNYGVIKSPEDLRGPENFLKLSAAVSLDRWDTVQEDLTTMFKTLMDVLF